MKKQSWQAYTITGPIDRLEMPESQLIIFPLYYKTPTTL